SGELPSGLLEGERVVAVAALETRIPRRLSRLNTAEERLKRPVEPLDNVLQDLRADLLVLGTELLDVGRLLHLRSGGDRNTRHAVGIPPLLQRCVIQFRAQDKLPFRLTHGRGRQFRLVLERLTHACSGVRYVSGSRCTASPLLPAHRPRSIR